MSDSSSISQSGIGNLTSLLDKKAQKKKMNATKIEGEMKVRIELWGRGGEISACPLTKEQYLHWRKEKKKDDDQFESMVTGFADDESGVGDDIKVLFWTEINALAHATGPELDQAEVRVFSDEDQLLWSSDLRSMNEDDDTYPDFATEADEFYFSASEEQHGIFIYQLQKGLFATFHIDEEWDPRKLKVGYYDIEDNLIVVSVSYNSVELKPNNVAETDTVRFQIELIDNS